MLQNYPQQKLFLINNSTGIYIRLCSFTLPQPATNLLFTITYSDTFNQGNILIVHFFNTAGITGFTGSAFGYSIGPSIIGNNLSSNSGNPIIFNQLSSTTFELWFWGYSVNSQCVLEISGIGNLQNLTYDGVATNTTITGNSLTVPIYTFWNNNTLQFDIVSNSLTNYDTKYYSNTNL